eukprot:10653886-Lingulodinium_polyedra.AAC.1
MKVTGNARGRRARAGTPRAQPHARPPTGSIASENARRGPSVSPTRSPTQVGPPTASTTGSYPMFHRR